MFNCVSYISTFNTMGANLGTESAQQIVGGTKTAAISLDRFSSALLTTSTSIDCAGRSIGRGLACLGVGIAIGGLSLLLAVVLLLQGLEERNF